jgi:hypothetical protein
MTEILKRKPGRPVGTSKGRDPLAFSEEELKKFLDATISSAISAAAPSGP